MYRQAVSRLLDRIAETEEFFRAGIVAIDITGGDPFTDDRTDYEDEIITTGTRPSPSWPEAEMDRASADGVVFILFQFVLSPMETEMRFFANFRATVGQKTLRREFDDVSTVGELAQTLSEEYPEMELFDADGSLREFIRIMKNGQDITHIDGLETELEDGDTVSIFPPVAGG